LRTFPLVAIASCGFIQACEQLGHGSTEVVAGAVEGLIAGMGFIGDGTILKEGLGVRGTATAASLRATGAIGLAVAMGGYDVAIVISAATFLTLRLPKRRLTGIPKVLAWRKKSACNAGRTARSRLRIVKFPGSSCARRRMSASIGDHGARPASAMRQQGGNGFQGHPPALPTIPLLSHPVRERHARPET
jgi:hypothetical protein